MPLNSSTAKSSKLVTITRYDKGTLMTGVEWDVLVCGCGGSCESRGSEYQGSGGAWKRLAICQSCGENFAMDKTYPTPERKF